MNYLTQIVNFTTRIPDCHYHSPALLDLFLPCDTGVCSTMNFLSLENSDHFVTAVSIDFPSNSKRDTLFYHISYDYSSADWDGLFDHLRDVPWEDLFKVGASAAASEFCEWFQVGTEVSGQALLISMFSAACPAVIVNRNHCFLFAPTK